MELNLSKSSKIINSTIVQNFIKEMEKALMKKEELTNYELGIYDRKEFEFLREFFDKRLSNTSRGETFIVHDKYYNDPKGRYHVAQYKEKQECLKIAFKENLPTDVKIGDVLVKKEDGNYYHDREATNYVRNNLDRIKQQIIAERDKD